GWCYPSPVKIDRFRQMKPKWVELFAASDISSLATTVSRGMSMRKKTLLGLLFVSTLFAMSCNRESQSRPVLRLAMIPSTDPGKIIRESQPLVQYLEKETGAKIELTVPTNYAAVVEAISNNQV